MRPRLCMGRCLAQFVILVIYIVATVSPSADNTGAFVASETAEEQTARERHFETSCNSVIDQERNQRYPESCRSPTETSHLEPQGSPFHYTIPTQHVAMQQMQGLQPAQSRILLSMQHALDGDKEVQEATRQKSQPKAKEGSDSDGTAPGRTREGGRRSNVVCREASLDYINASDQSGSSVGNGPRFKQSPLAATTYIAPATTSWEQWECRSRGHDGEGSSNFATSGRLGEGRHDPLGRHEGSEASLGSQEAASSQSETAYPWSLVQIRESERTDQCNCWKNWEHGPGMEQVHDRHFQQGCSTCNFVSSMPERDGGELSQEGGRAGTVEAGHAGCFFSHACTRAPNGRDPSNAQCQSADAGFESSHEGQHASSNHGSVRRRGNGGGFSNEREWQGATESTFPTITIAIKSSQCPPEGQRGQTMSGETTDESDDEHFPWTSAINEDVCSQSASSEPCHLRESSSEACSVFPWMSNMQYQQDMKEDKTKGIWSWELLMPVEKEVELSGCNDICASHAGRKGKKVRFHDRVDIHIFHEESEAKFELLLDDVHIALSHCWSSQIASSWMRSNRVLEGYVGVGRQSENDDHREPLNQGRLEETNGAHDSDAISDLWKALPRYDDRNLKVQNIETWFLCKNRFRTCQWSRAVQIRPDMTTAEFKKSCNDKWKDKISSDDLKWYVVQNAPRSTPSISAHVILCQDPCENMQAHLLHWDAWPILNKFRAVMIPMDASVEETLAIAGVHRVCSSRDVLCNVQCESDGILAHFCHHERFRFPNSRVLYGYVVHVPQSDSEEGSSDSANDTSTRAPDTSDGGDTDEFSWVTLQGPVMSFDDQGPFPWELQDLDDDAAIEVEPEQPDFTFLEEHELDMHMHAQAIRDSTTEENDRWVAITFGLGLTDLGRREMEFRPDELQQIPQRIMTMWQDHIQNGESQLIFVNPQPERMHRLPYLVFIVAVDYGVPGEHEMRKILVREHSYDREMIRNRPYAALVHNFVSPRGILMHLQHHECFPAGIRECSVKIQHELLDTFQAHEIPQGALCDIYIDLFPEFVQEAERTVHGAEQMFKIAKAMFEETEPLPIIIRAHGISPANTPLGYKDVITTYGEMHNLEWIRVARTLWPFDDQFADLVFVPDANMEIIEMGQPLILHLIVNYNTDVTRCPISIRQQICHVEGMKRHFEWWAKALPKEVQEDNLRREIHQPPFWCIEGAVTHIYRDGKILKQQEPDWSKGQQLELKLNVHTRHHMLHVLMTCNKREFDTIEPDTSSWLQISQVSHRQFDDVPDAVVHKQGSHQDPIDEICIQYSKDVEKIMSQGHSYAEPEDNSSLRKASDTGTTNEAGVQHSHHKQQDIVELQDILTQLQTGEWQGLNRDYERVPNMHTAAQYAFETTAKWHEIPNCGNIHIFTDGSSSQCQAAWAFVVILEYVHAGITSYVRLGYAAGAVDHDLGDFLPDAIDAEATALIAAGEFLLKQQWAAWRHVYCHFDAKAVGYAAAGRQNIPVRKSGASTRVENARIMISLVQQKYEMFHPCHVFAHEGNPFNEAADSFAQGYRQGWRPDIPAVLQSGNLWRHSLRKWAWIEIRHTQELPGLTNILMDEVRDDPCPWPDQVFKMGKPATDEGKQAILCMATVNVGTMNYREAKQEITMSLKASAILHQFEEVGYDFAMLQETRGAHSQCLRQGSFVRIASAANQGQGGLETWINVETLQQKLGIEVQEKDITVWHQDSRVLALTLSVDGFLLTVINAYGPQQGRGTDFVRQWWEEFANIVQSRPMQGPLIIAGDFNAKVGSVTNEWIGECDSDMENDAGSDMRQMCEKQCLLVPSTFSETHKGQSATYTNPKGFKSRLDYFLLSEQCVPGLLHTVVNDDIDVMNGDWDHKVLELHLGLQADRKATNGWKRMTRYDRKAAATSQFSCIPELPEQPWSRDINEHWSYLRDGLQSSCQKHYPMKKRNQRQAYFSDEVWQLVCDRKDVKKQHRSQQFQFNQLVLKQCFQAWKQRNSEEASRIDVEIHAARLQEAITYEARTAIDQNFRARKKGEWKIWAVTKAEEMRVRANAAKGAAIFHAIQPKKAIMRHTGQHRKALPGLRNKNGTWAFSRRAIASEWEAQFAEIENARDETMENLMCRSKPSRLKPDAKIFDEIPTLYDFELAIRNLQLGKAPGVDSIGPEILKVDPCETAKKFYPLILKGAMRKQWVAEFGGGWILPLHKGKMAKQAMEGYRAILLEPCIARAVSRAWRPKMQAAYEAIAAPGQWGGRRGLGIEALHLCIRLAQSTARWAKASLAIIFVDIKSAFYSIAKPLLSHDNVTREDVDDLCDIMKIPASAREAFWINIQNSNIIEAATGSSLAADAAKASLANTWFCVPDGTQLKAPSTGSRPGDPCADTLFSVIMAVILEEINSRLQMHQVYDTTPHPDITISQNVTWVDDSAFLIQSPADSIHNQITVVMSTILDVMTEHGLALSFGPGKTAVMVNFHGPQAHTSRVKFEQDTQGEVLVMNEHLPSVKVPVVPHYKHLGGHLIRNGSVLAEIKVRAAQTAAKMTPLKKITKDPKLDVGKRKLLVKSIGMPILSLHAGTWFDLRWQEQKAWQASVHKLYGAIETTMPQDGDSFAGLAQRALEMEAPMPMEWLYIQRLRLMIQIAKEGDIFMFSAIVYNHRMARDSSWLYGLQCSVEWMLSQIGRERGVLPLHHLDQVDAWFDLRHYVHKLKKSVKDAQKAHQFRLRAYVELKDTQEKQTRLLEAMGWKCSKESHGCHSDPEPEDEKICPECLDTFPTNAALAVHQQKVHSARMAVRRYVANGACLHCGKWFHTRTRLMTHLQWSGTPCWLRLLRSLEPMTVEQANELDDLDRKKGEAFHQHGLRSFAQDQACRQATEQERAQQYQKARDNPSLEVGPITDQEQEDWRVIGTLPTGRGGKEKTKRKVQESQILNVASDIHELERKWRLQVLQWEPDDSWVPRPLAEGQKYLLIFFSGRRREQDLAWWMAQESNIIPIAIDTAVDEVWGNVMQESLWLRLIVARKVIGAHAGPPCESFSMARWNPVGSNGGPRPLRDKSCPWGLLYRKIMEVCQTVLGNVLFGRVFYLLLVVYAHGGAFTLEHPQGPVGNQLDNRWSIWQSAFIQRALLAAEINLVSFEQGPLGRTFRKPTNLLTGRLPHMSFALWKESDRQWVPTEKLGGRDAKGAWKTSAAKEYPARMNMVLARQFIWFANQIQCEGSEESPQELEQILSHLACWDPYLEDGQVMKGDFQPETFLK